MTTLCRLALALTILDAATRGRAGSR
eukprot:COSAG06_NODE_66679_length_253_cov_3.357143_1_plen_25_part_10